MLNTSNISWRLRKITTTHANHITSYQLAVCGFLFCFQFVTSTSPTCVGHVEGALVTEVAWFFCSDRLLQRHIIHFYFLVFILQTILTASLAFSFKKKKNPQGRWLALSLFGQLRINQMGDLLRKIDWLQLFHKVILMSLWPRCGRRHQQAAWSDLTIALPPYSYWDTTS